VAVETDVERAIGATLQRFGRVDSLFANAGIAAFAPYVDTALSDASCEPIWTAAS
jgi:NAD(P)-dependent dehydrogenase (short-subunit alcohol dehydrogenase family)